MAMVKAQARYTKLFFVQIPLIQLGLSAGTYATICYGLPMLGMTSAQAAVTSKIEFLAQHDLGWVYLAVYIVALGRDRIAANSNAVRAGARVDRPDQHVCEYHAVSSCVCGVSMIMPANWLAHVRLTLCVDKIMDPKTAGSSTPYVLMSNTGWTGRFNRAQRGAFNTDESLP